MSANIWQGTRIRLRAVEPSDWESHFEWDQDTDLGAVLDHVYFPKSKEATRQWAEQMALRTTENDSMHLQIETLAGELVGAIDSHTCDPHNGTFSYGVAIRKKYQRKGYASEAITLLLRYFFQERRYQKVTVHIYSFNEASIRLHESLGYQLEGRLRRMIFTGGQFYDILYYGLTVDEFKASELAPR